MLECCVHLSPPAGVCGAMGDGGVGCVRDSECCHCETSGRTIGGH